MLYIGKDGGIVMTKDGEIIDISQYRKTRGGSKVLPSLLVEDWEREAIDQLINESEPVLTCLESLNATHLKMTALENRIKALEEGRKG